jgi:hypothetical protein
MPNDKGLRLGADPDREPFTTIDDLVKQARQLFRGLRQLSEYKHPLDIRRGIVIRKGVMKRMNKDRLSKQVKASGRTYFLDVEQTKEGKPYLRITESRKGDGDQWERASINVFPEDAALFAEAVSEMVSRLDEG